MTTLLYLLIATVTGTGFAALMAGGYTARKKTMLWSAGGILWALSGGIAAFFQKKTIEVIVLKKAPFLTNITIPNFTMLMIGLGVFACGIMLFPYIFNCRKNSTKWYWAILWSAGLIFFLHYILFMPGYYGTGTWLKLAGLLPESPRLTEILVPFSVWAAWLFTATILWTWHTLKTVKHSWKNILIFAGGVTGFTAALWLSAWGAGAWAEKAMKSQAAKSAIAPCRVYNGDHPAFAGDDFYTKYPKYQPPRSGKYDWSKNAIPADEKEFTLKFFTSPELEKYLEELQKQVSSHDKNALEISQLNHFRSLVRHRADIAELYSHSNQYEKILPELLKYPALDTLIPADTPFLICELVRTVNRKIWLEALLQFGPEDKQYLPHYRKLLEWCKNWQIRLPSEAGMYLTEPPADKKGLAAFFYTPYLRALRYRGFREAITRIPDLKKMRQLDVIPGNGHFANAARTQRQMIVLGRTALALKIYLIEHGKLPEKLSALVPHYLEKEYVSPQTGQKLTYRVKDISWCYEVNGVHSLAARSCFTLSADDKTLTSLPAIDIVGKDHRIISLKSE